VKWAFVISFFFIGLGFGQESVQRIETVLHTSRLGTFQNISYARKIKRFEGYIGIGTHVQNMFVLHYFSPELNVGLFYELSKSEKLSLAIGGRYSFLSRRYPANPSASFSSMNYCFSLVYGEKWKFIHRLGVGGSVQMNTNNPVFLLDTHLSFGVGYAF
jgi:hypothetical protein